MVVACGAMLEVVFVVLDVVVDVVTVFDYSMMAQEDL